jgi:DNA-binding NtrC family response regulator
VPPAYIFCVKQKKAVLSPADRELFSLVAQAIFTNPFAPEREQIDARLDQGAGGSSRWAPAGRVERVLGRLGARLARLEAEDRAHLRRYAAEDRQRLAYALLFDAYYRLVADLDRLIDDQAAAGDRPLPVPFARRALDHLVRRGFERETAAVHFAMFFQIRRAFYFIDRALVGKSRSMRELRRGLWDNVFTSDIRWYDEHLRGRMEDFSTLLLGETGTGKGSAAAAIGRSGFIPFDEKSGAFRESFTRAFTAINLSEFPESLIESELFGHQKGAFTGAVESHEGVLARCSPHGAIFLDEIGEIGPAVQIKLLRVLEERSFTPVGSHDRKRFHGRVIAATNRRLEEHRAQGAFRDDFFYRLCSDIIHVPPLRERLAEDPEELEALVRHLLRRLLGVDALPVAEVVLSLIARQLGRDYSWPGNVRELEQCVRRILLKRRYEGGRSAAARDGADPLARRILEGALDAREALAAYCALLHERHGNYERAARAARLDPRTLRKHAEEGLALRARGARQKADGRRAGGGGTD